MPNAINTLTQPATDEPPLNAALNSQLHHDLINHIGNTLIAGIAVFLIFIVIYFVFKNKNATLKQGLRYRFRLIYLAIFFYLILLARIWVEGFEHIFTMLSLVGAGIVVTNKETVMNFVGWLIITWRNLFVEGDVIQIGTNIGIVSKIGLLYFKLYETGGVDSLQTTGKTIKIPNGLVITLPVFSVSPDNNFLQYRFLILLDPTLDKLQTSIEVLQKKFNQILAQYYKKNCINGFKRLEESHEAISAFINKKCTVDFHYTPGKDTYAETTFRFFCYPKDQKELQWRFLETVEKEVKKGTVFVVSPEPKES